MSVLTAGKYLQALHAGVRQLVFRKHALDGVFDDALWELLTNFSQGCVFDTTRETCVVVVYLAGFFVAGNDRIFGVDDDNVVTTVNVRPNQVVRSSAEVRARCWRMIWDSWPVGGRPRRRSEA